MSEAEQNAGKTPRHGVDPQGLVGVESGAAALGGAAGPMDTAPAEAAETESAKKDAARAEAEDEGRRIRRLQIMMNMVMSVLYQDDISLDEAMELAANAKRAALAMFPDKELAFDLLYKPRIQRVVRERFHLQ